MREKYNDYSAAMTLLNKAEQAAPDDPATKYNIACLFALEGKKEDALAKLRQALALGDQELRENALNDSCLESLREDAEFKSLTTEQPPEK